MSLHFLFLTFHDFEQQKAVYGHRESHMKRIMEEAMPRLQQYVRGSWKSHGKSKLSGDEDRFIKLIVNPCVDTNVAAVPHGMGDVLGKMTAMLQTGTISEEHICSIKLACASLQGALEEHPLVQGLALQAFRMVQKQQRAIFHMRGRRSCETEAEREAIADSGIQLSLLGANGFMAKEFGLNVKAMKTSVDQVETYSLPSPGLALMFKEAGIKLPPHRHPLLSATGCPETPLGREFGIGIVCVEMETYGNVMK